MRTAGAWRKPTRRFSVEPPLRVENSIVRRAVATALTAAIALVFGWVAGLAQPPGDPAAVKEEDGKHFDKDGTPTFKIGADGAVDWYTYSGYRRYHSECHVCHGPDGEGSTYAPSLKDSVKKLSYGEFFEVVVNGRQEVGTAQQQVMPAFGLNANVMCYLDDIYVYLRARGENAVGRVRPAKRAAKPEAFDKAESICLGEQK
jgi:methanol metabolism-related c-type cytochrome